MFIWTMGQARVYFGAWLVCICWLYCARADDNTTLDTLVNDLLYACHVYDEQAMPRLVDEIARHGRSASPELIALLGNEDANVRWQAVNAMAKIGKSDARLIQPLLSAGRDVDPDVRGAAILALAEHLPGSEATLSLAQRLTRDSVPTVRAHAWRAVATADNTEDAVAALIALLEHPDWMASHAATQHLIEVGQAAGGPLLQSFGRLQTQGLLRAIEAVSHIKPASPSAVTSIARLLHHDEPRVVTAACAGLGRMGQPAIEPLLRAAMVRDTNGARGAIAALGTMGRTAAPAVPVILGRLHDSDQGLRIACIQALSNIACSKQDVVAALIPSLEAEHADVRSAAAAALGTLGPDATRHIADIRRLASHDPVDYVRRAASRAIKQLHGPKADGT